MIRETSIETYLQIKKEGLLSKSKIAVYECVFNHGPMTAGEVFSRLNLKTNQSGRFTELRDLGVFKEVGKRVCGSTGRTAILWDVTWELPKKPKQGRSEKDYAIHLINDIQSNLFLSDPDKMKLSELKGIVKNL